jgi:hypothetical protein
VHAQVLAVFLRIVYSSGNILLLFLSCCKLNGYIPASFFKCPELVAYKSIHQRVVQSPHFYGEAGSSRGCYTKGLNNRIDESNTNKYVPYSPSPLMTSSYVKPHLGRTYWQLIPHIEVESPRTQTDMHRLAVPVHSNSCFATTLDCANSEISCENHKSDTETGKATNKEVVAKIFLTRFLSRFFDVPLTRCGQPQP